MSCCAQQALANQPKVNWGQVALANSEWHHDQQGLRPAGAAVLVEVVSKIAPTTVNGIPNTMGGATQSIVVDRSQFTLPVKTGTIVFRK